MLSPACVIQAVSGCDQAAEKPGRWREEASGRQQLSRPCRHQRRQADLLRLRVQPARAQCPRSWGDGAPLPNRGSAGGFPADPARSRKGLADTQVSGWQVSKSRERAHEMRAGEQGPRAHLLPPGQTGQLSYKHTHIHTHMHALIAHTPQTHTRRHTRFPEPELCYGPVTHAKYEHENTWRHESQPHPGRATL